MNREVSDEEMDEIAQTLADSIFFDKLDKSIELLRSSRYRAGDWFDVLIVSIIGHSTLPRVNKETFIRRLVEMEWEVAEIVGLEESITKENWVAQNMVLPVDLLDKLDESLTEHERRKAALPKYPRRPNNAS